MPLCLKFARIVLLISKCKNILQPKDFRKIRVPYPYQHPQPCVIAQTLNWSYDQISIPITAPGTSQPYPSHRSLPLTPVMAKMRYPTSVEMHMREKCLAAMLAGKRLAGVAPEVNLRECTPHRYTRNLNWGIRCPKMELCLLNIKFKKTI